jgi:chemotaxis protein methyltransferase CheR
MSAFQPDNLGLTAVGLPLLRDLIHERTGLFFDNGRYETLFDRVAPLVIGRGLRSILDFYYLLKYDDGSAADEWRNVMDALAVNETYFWREVDQMQALASRVMPELERHALGRPVRIWSAPCAPARAAEHRDGLNEGGWFDRVPIEIHASDGSAAVTPRAGRPLSGAGVSDAAADARKYFTRTDDLDAEPEPAARIASWSVVNLMHDQETAVYATSPVIFCRNAFIYFSPESVKHGRHFADRMRRRYSLGASESLLNVARRFMLDDLEHAFVYVKC